MNIRQWFKMAFFFGSFQAIMPVIGWLAGIILVALGVKILFQHMS